MVADRRTFFFLTDLVVDDVEETTTVTGGTTAVLLVVVVVDVVGVLSLTSRPGADAVRAGVALLTRALAIAACLKKRRRR
jgi:hypothetical protein